MQDLRDKIRDRLFEYFQGDPALVGAGLLGVLLFELEKVATMQKLWFLFDRVSNQENFMEFITEVSRQAMKRGLNTSCIADVDTKRVRESLFAIVVGHAFAWKETQEEGE